jgi:diaminopimelate epimerase
VVAVLNPIDKKCDLKMRIINSDGSEAQMCGNGLACFALYAAESLKDINGAKRINSKSSPAQSESHKKIELKIETNAGLRGAKIVKTRSGVYKVILDMGAPEIKFVKKVRVDNYNFTLNAVSMGNPHCVIFLDERLPPAEFERIGPIIERHKLFIDKTNVEFVTVKDGSEIEIAVWERGAGKTLACGTGASAAAFAAHKKELCGAKIKIRLPGGECAAEVTPSGRVLLECSPVKVFEGLISDFVSLNL